MGSGRKMKPTEKRAANIEVSGVLISARCGKSAVGSGR
jgi:hypothetical protein